MPEYTVSLLIFILPGLALYAFIWGKKLLRGSQKRAFYVNLALLSLLGFILDLGFADKFFRFPDPSMTLGITLRGIPIEEFIFYVSGFWFILIVYVFGDEYFLSRYNRPDSHYFRFANLLRHRLYIEVFSRGSILILLFLLIGVLLKAILNPDGSILPGYLIFLALVAYVPFMLFWPLTRRFLNTRAFFFTVIITTLLSVIWEVTLALPRGYWNYQTDNMLGIFISPWHDLPVEAVTVWGFSSIIILGYEYSKIAFFRDPGRQFKAILRLRKRAAL